MSLCTKTHLVSDAGGESPTPTHSSAAFRAGERHASYRRVSAMRTTGSAEIRFAIRRGGADRGARNFGKRAHATSYRCDETEPASPAVSRRCVHHRGSVAVRQRPRRRRCRTLETIQSALVTWLSVPAPTSSGWMTSCPYAASAGKRLTASARSPSVRLRDTRAESARPVGRPGPRRCAPLARARISTRPWPWPWRWCWRAPRQWRWPALKPARPR